MEINNIHDKLVKEILSNKENAIDFLYEILPTEMSEGLDFQTLKFANTSYITPELKETFSDIVMDCTLKNGKNLQISILLEHKSYKSPHASFQILGYQSKGYLQQLASGKSLRLIIPLLFYHGKEKWQFRPVEDFFTEYPQYLQSYVPRFDTIFKNANEMQEDIEDLPNAVLAAMLITQLYNDDIPHMLNLIYEVVKFMPTSELRNSFKPIFVFIFEITSKKGGIDLYLDQNSNLKKIYMSLTEEYDAKVEARGVAKGVAEGVALGVAEGELKTQKIVVTNMYKNGMAVQLIANIAQISTEKIIEILKSEGLWSNDSR
jgi:predicted transposase/invertase (TIGR01784 family)